MSFGVGDRGTRTDCPIDRRTERQFGRDGLIGTRDVRRLSRQEAKRSDGRTVTLSDGDTTRVVVDIPNVGPRLVLVDKAVRATVPERRSPLTADELRAGLTFHV